jgi:transcriptional regulator with XRE-family HTH domain
VKPPTGRTRGDQVDLHVAGRIRLRRTRLGISRENLAASIGLTVHQVQSYEQGRSRIAPRRLFDLARALDVPVSYFFDGLAAISAHPPGRRPIGFEPKPRVKRETVVLVRAYWRIADACIRKQLFELTKSLAAHDDTIS